jgi:hypothetical protein
MMLACCCAAQPTVKLLINGEFVDSKSSNWLDVHNPVGASTPASKGNPSTFTHLHTGW